MTKGVGCQDLVTSLPPQFVVLLHSSVCVCPLWGGGHRGICRFSVCGSLSDE